MHHVWSTFPHWWTWCCLPLFPIYKPWVCHACLLVYMYPWNFWVMGAHRFNFTGYCPVAPRPDQSAFASAGPEHSLCSTYSPTFTLAQLCFLIGNHLMGDGEEWVHTAFFHITICWLSLLGLLKFSKGKKQKNRTDTGREKSETGASMLFQRVDLQRAPHQDRSPHHPSRLTPSNYFENELWIWEDLGPGVGSRLSLDNSLHSGNLSFLNSQTRTMISII